MFGENLMILRKQKGMSQEVLAQQLNVVRQTISKWEKGLSVPDAEMLMRIAELFEISVSKLLGSKVEDDKSMNEVAAQLALLNEQLAYRSRRTRKIWTIILGILIAMIVVSVLSSILFRFNNSSGTITTTQLTCTLDGKEYIYQISYNDQYRIRTAGGAEFIADHVNTEQYSDANILIAQIEDYFTEHGGTCKRNDSK